MYKRLSTLLLISTLAYANFSMIIHAMEDENLPEKTNDASRTFNTFVEFMDSNPHQDLQKEVALEIAKKLNIEVTRTRKWAAPHNYKNLLQTFSKGFITDINEIEKILGDATYQKGKPHILWKIFRDKMSESKYAYLNKNNKVNKEFLFITEEGKKFLLDCVHAAMHEKTATSPDKEETAPQEQIQIQLPLPPLPSTAIPTQVYDPKIPQQTPVKASLHPSPVPFTPFPRSQVQLPLPPLFPTAIPAQGPIFTPPHIHYPGSRSSPRMISQRNGARILTQKVQDLLTQKMAPNYTPQKPTYPTTTMPFAQAHGQPTQNLHMPGLQTTPFKNVLHQNYASTTPTYPIPTLPFPQAHEQPMVLQQVSQTPGVQVENDRDKLRKYNYLFHKNVLMYVNLKDDEANNLAHQLKDEILLGSDLFCHKLDLDTKANILDFVINQLLGRTNDEEIEQLVMIKSELEEYTEQQKAWDKIKEGRKRGRENETISAPPARTSFTPMVLSIVDEENDKETDIKETKRRKTNDQGHGEGEKEIPSKRGEKDDDALKVIKLSQTFKEKLTSVLRNKKVHELQMKGYPHRKLAKLLLQCYGQCLPYEGEDKTANLKDEREWKLAAIQWFLAHQLSEGFKSTVAGLMQNRVVQKLYRLCTTREEIADAFLDLYGSNIPYEGTNLPASEEEINAKKRSSLLQYFEELGIEPLKQ